MTGSPSSRPAPSSWPAPATQPARPQFAVIGGGIRGRSYAAAVQRNPDAELVAICDPSPAAQQSLAEQLQVPVHPDTATLLAAHPDVTAAVVATPDFAHLDPVLACLDRGMDLLIEKPLATDIGEARTMAAAAATTGARTLIAFENRWNPKFLAVREDLTAVDGAVVNQIVNLNDTVFVPTRMLAWAAQSTPGWFLFPHSLDLAIWLGGSHPVEVVARGVRQHLAARGIDTWDAITATFTMADGSLVTLNSQWVLPESMPAVFDFRYELNATSAAYRIEISDSGVMRYGETAGSALHPPEHDLHHRPGGVIAEMTNDFIDHLRGADLDLPDMAQGLRITEAIDAAHRSLVDGGPQRIGS